MIICTSVGTRLFRTIIRVLNSTIITFQPRTDLIRVVTDGRRCASDYSRLEARGGSYQRQTEYDQHDRGRKRLGY